MNERKMKRMLMGSHTSSPPTPLKKNRTSSAAVVYNKSFNSTLKDAKKEDMTKEPKHRPAIIPDGLVPRMQPAPHETE